MGYTITQVHGVTNDKGEVGLSKCASRKLLNIRSRVTFIRHCQALGYEGLEYFYPEHLKQLLAIALFTRLGGSRHSREQFLKYQRAKLLDRKLR
ncbi:hypothetical protein NDI37_25510 [Funiculus sociatus GB2-A5]|uniref:Homing endonuclease LAGLIDADG domain-containing protein n=1 Tax=Funiculus sociatus GB2-A5 TaxID=2933946 RepID=A0ABV0JWL4_9CYAN|nr:hypothetical protein [Trichocoleus sp. FACHB-6]MBD2060681.1 hypothetical protein [Trichocoleus sp. FACHB-6]